MIKKYKKFFAVAVILTFLLVLVPFVSRAIVVKSGDNVLVAKDLDSNFFGAGNLVIITGDIEGDVFVAGNNISIRGDIKGDVFAAGSSIDISGNVNGSLRVVGSNINIRGRIHRNILSAAANLIIDEGAFIGGHITYAGASLVLNSPVLGNIDAVVQSMAISNEVSGNINLRMDTEGSSLSLMRGAILRKDLNYKAPSQVEIGEGVQILGETRFSPVEPKIKADKSKMFWFLKKFFLAMRIIGFFSLFLTGLLLIYLIPNVLNKVTASMKKKPWANIGIGFVVLVVSPVAGILLLFTVVGIPLALLALFCYCVLIYLAKVMVSIGLGKLICDYFDWQVHKILSLLLGLLFFALISLIPFVGWLVAFILVLWAFGALLRVDIEMLKKFR